MEEIRVLLENGTPMAESVITPVADRKKVQQIMNGIGHLTEPKSENRRRRTRVELDTTLFVTLLTNAALPQIRITTRDLSVAGLGFVCRRPFRLGELVAVHLHVPGFPAKLVLARTIFCMYSRATMYLVGVEFVAALSAKTGKEDEIRIPQAWLNKARDEDAA